jgi:hypothetical protein
MKTSLIPVRPLTVPANAAVQRVFPMLLILAVMIVTHLSSAHGSGAGIIDSAGFFSDAAKQEAAKLITDAARESRKDLCIESLKELPKEIQSAVGSQNKAGADRLYEQFTVKQAAKNKVNGVYILLVRQPAHLHVVVGDETAHRVFTMRDKEALLDLMLGHLRKKEFDEALLKGSRFVTATMKANTLPGISSSDHWPKSDMGLISGGKFGWLGTALIVLLAVMLISRLIGAIFSGGSPGLGGSPASGGGFFGSLMGSLFGAAAGMWIYDHFFGHQGGQSAFGADSSGPIETDGGMQDKDYSGSGADFDENPSDLHQSGGDFGGDFDGGSGSDSGGGDWGGDL